MAWSFEPVGWEDEDGAWWQGAPDETELDDTYGVLVHAYDDSTGEHNYFWAFIPETFDSWDDWWDYIGALMGAHGMAL